MLTISNLSYRIGGRTIIDDANLTVMDGWRVGVVGANGAGKSTLFKLIAGELQADGGTVAISARHRLGMVRQDIPDCDTPLVEMVTGADKELTQLLHDAERETDAYKLADIYARLTDMDAYAAPARASRLLTGLGFRESQLQEPFSSFSGGWRMRVALAAALFVQPEVLLLDEPTNHLDLEAIMWLEDYLAAYPHTLLIISHDRQLLNKCVDHVIHVERQKMTVYTGDYDTFERERAERIGLQQKMFEKQQAQRAHMQSFVDRFKAQASKARQAQSRVKALEKMDLVEQVIADRATRFTFPQPDELPPPLLAINHADVGYQESVPILRRVNQTVDMDDRIALLGANGNGKSTLIKLIAGKLDAMNGQVVRSKKLRIGYFSQHQTDELDVGATPYEAMHKLMHKKNPDVKEPAVRAKLGQFGFSRELADNKISSLSGGEKARLLFAFMSFDAPHMLLLDEPTNHLDIEAREALIMALNEYQGAVVIVSHDPGMVERVADRLWLVKDGACQPFEGDLNDYRKFIIQSRRDEKRQEKKSKTVKDASPAPAKASRSLAMIEKDLEKLETDKIRCETRLADGDLYRDGGKARKAQQDYDTVLAKIAALENEWLAAQDQAQARRDAS